MIRKITFENFCSLREKGFLDLTTSAKTPTDHSFTPSAYGDQVSILGGIFGPNASGKTNLLKVFCFLNFFIHGSYYNLKADDLIPVDSFANSAEPLSFSIEFESQGEIYRYELQLTREKILTERLRLFYKKTNSFRIILQRKEGKNGPVVTQPDHFTEIKTLNSILKDRPNASMLAAGFVTGRPEFEAILRALGGIESNVNRPGKTDSHASTHVSQLIDCARYLKENDHFMEEVELRLQQADLGISELEIREIEMANQEKGTTEKVPFPFVKHKTAEGDFTNSLANESSGTKRLFTLLRSFLPVLTNGGIAVIDEMESDLHPHLIPLLLDLFTDQDTNPKRAQLIFTCHHVEVLNQLAKEQIFLVDKDDLNASTVTRLSDLKGVRRDENHFANYNAGRYRAIPEPEFY